MHINIGDYTKWINSIDVPGTNGMNTGNGTQIYNMYHKTW